MKLYEVCILDDMEEVIYLTVSDKTHEELEQHVNATGEDDYNCFMACSVREIEEVDGYRIKLEKIYTVKTETRCIDCENYRGCDYVVHFTSQYNMYKAGEDRLNDNMIINCNYYKMKE